MNWSGLKLHELSVKGFSMKETMVTLGVLFAGLLITALSVFYTRNNIERAALADFDYSCNELRIKVESRLSAHAQLLRSGEALMAIADTVTMEQWHLFYERTRIDQFLPGIQGFGYSHIIKPEKLQEHINFFRKNGFPQYTISPPGKRDIYTSIIYLEPFTGRNLLAFGYDMYSESVRRKAMESARDSNMAMLSGKVTLVQETGEDVQAGVLMYIPVFRAGMPTGTVEERRAAIKGWVYSPYRMKDLMSGIQGNKNFSLNDPIRLQIYDDNIISDKELLYDSEYNGYSLKKEKPDLVLKLPIQFNGKAWTLVFTGNKDEISMFRRGQVIVWITGITISLLLFVLSVIQIRANMRARQIDQLNKQLERLNEDKTRFIAILSHDLKSPFTSILGFLELLTSGLRKYSIDQIESHIHHINEATRSAYNLLEDILTWIRAHAGNIPFEPVRLTFREIYESVLENLLPLAESKKISVEYSENEAMHVTADRDMLKTILRNLISNAIKFTETGGKIRIIAERKQGHVMISVADNGRGIRPEQINTIFNISKKYSTAGTAGERGSGLGLALCHELIETHEGKLWVTSESGKGSVFSFTLPDRKTNVKNVK